MSKKSDWRRRLFPFQRNTRRESNSQYRLDRRDSFRDYSSSQNHPSSRRDFQHANSSYESGFGARPASDHVMEFQDQKNESTAQSLFDEKNKTFALPHIPLVGEAHNGNTQNAMPQLSSSKNNEIPSARLSRASRKKLAKFLAEGIPREEAIQMIQSQKLSNFLAAGIPREVAIQMLQCHQQPKTTEATVLGNKNLVAEAGNDVQKVIHAGIPCNRETQDNFSSAPSDSIKNLQPASGQKAAISKSDSLEKYKHNQKNVKRMRLSGSGRKRLARLLNDGLTYKEAYETAKKPLKDLHDLGTKNKFGNAKSREQTRNISLRYDRESYFARSERDGPPRQNKNFRDESPYHLRNHNVPYQEQSSDFDRLETPRSPRRNNSPLRGSEQTFFQDTGSSNFRPYDRVVSPYKNEEPYQGQSQPRFRDRRSSFSPDRRGSLSPLHRKSSFLDMEGNLFNKWESSGKERSASPFRNSSFPKRFDRNFMYSTSREDVYRNPSFPETFDTSYCDEKQQSSRNSNYSNRDRSCSPVNVRWHTPDEARHSLDGRQSPLPKITNSNLLDEEPLSSGRQGSSRSSSPVTNKADTQNSELVLPQAASNSFNVIPQVVPNLIHPPMMPLMHGIMEERNSVLPQLIPRPLMETPFKLDSQLDLFWPQIMPNQLLPLPPPWALGEPNPMMPLPFLHPPIPMVPQSMQAVQSLEMSAPMCGNSGGIAPSQLQYTATIRQGELVKNPPNTSDDLSPDQGRKQKNKESAIRIGVSHLDHPRVLLTNDQITSTKSILFDAILVNSDPKFKPAFTGCIKKNGWLVFSCANANTAEWLKKVVPSLSPWKNGRLKAFDYNEQNKIVFASFPSNASSLSDKEILKALKSQNDLNTDKWTVLFRRTGAKGDAHLTMSIDYQSFEKLDKAKFTAFFQYSKVKMHPSKYLNLRREKYKLFVESKKKQDGAVFCAPGTAGV